jgi:epoxyqueuosine reductase QueG
VTPPLEARLEALARSQGARFFGIADLAPAREEVLRLGGEEVAAFPRAISVGVALSHRIVDQLPDASIPEVAGRYRRYVDEVKVSLRSLEAALSELLREEGHATLEVPVSERKDDRYPDAIFSHKLAAHLAGLGWIGKSCLLVTPELGPRVRWTSVLTDASLRPTGGPSAEGCGSCLKCVDICPVEAFSGRAFTPGEPREARFDAEACDAHIDRLEKQTGFKTCGLCVYVCPHGRRAAGREKYRGGR